MCVCACACACARACACVRACLYSYVHVCMYELMTILTLKEIGARQTLDNTRKGLDNKSEYLYTVAVKNHDIMQNVVQKSTY